MHLACTFATGVSCYITEKGKSLLVNRKTLQTYHLIIDINFILFNAHVEIPTHHSFGITQNSLT